MKQYYWTLAIGDEEAEEEEEEEEEEFENKIVFGGKIMVRASHKSYMQNQDINDSDSSLILKAKAAQNRRPSVCQSVSHSMYLIWLKLSPKIF